MRKAVLLALTLLVLTPVVTGAQTRSRRTTTRQPASAPKVSTAVRAAAERIAAQAKVLSGFLYLYGGVVKAIEASDQTARDGAIPPAALARIKANKESVVTSIRNIQGGLKQMEEDFLGDPSLKMYSQHVNGLSEDVGLAADAAAADKFDDSGKRLVLVVGVLLDALLPQT